MANRMDRWGYYKTAELQILKPINTVAHVTASRSKLLSLTLFCSNVSVAASCLENTKTDCASSDYTHILWLSTMGLADANVYLCSSSELRQGKASCINVFFYNIRCVSKRTPGIFSCNLSKYRWILLHFGRNVSQKVDNQKIVFYYLTWLVFLQYLAKLKNTEIMSVILGLLVVQKH